MSAAETFGPLTRSQELLWAGQQRYPDKPLYNMALAFTIHGAIDVDRFTQAASSLCRNCDTFRTTFRENHGSVVREIDDERSSAEFSVVDLRNDPDPEAAASALIKLKAARLFEPAVCLTEHALLLLSTECSVWFLNQHHLITDGGNASVVFDAMQHAYRGVLDEKLPDYPEEAIQDNEKSRKYWETLDQGLEPVTLYGRSLTVEAIASTRRTFKLGPERTRKLKQLALSDEYRGFTEDLSMFQMFSGLLFAFIHRMTGETHLGIAAPTHNRTTPRLKRTPGVFIEVFPLEVQLGESPSFADILQTVRREALSYLTHAQPGFSCPDLAARSQILLNMVNAGFDSFAGFPVTTEWVHSGFGDRQHALRLAVFDFERSDDLTLLFDFNDEAFNDQRREWAVRHFFRLIDRLLEDPTQTIGKVDLLNQDERLALETFGRGTEGAFDDKATVVDLFENSRWDHPDRLAAKGPSLLDGDIVCVTYEQLDSHANQLANHLADLGVERGDHVGLLLEPSLEWVSSMLAIIKTGAAYFPLSLEEPKVRLANMIEDAEVHVVVTLFDQAGNLPSSPRVVCLDRDASAIASAPDVAPKREITSNDRFYLISTSGSTGKPKAVCGRHVSVVNLLTDFENRDELAQEEATCSWWTSPTFDVSIYEIWSALAYGRTLHIVPSDLRVDTAQVLRLLENEQIHSAYLPAFMLEEMANGRASLGALRRLLVGVEPIQEALLQRLLRRYPALRIINGYGPAEATVCATLYEVTEDSPGDRPTPIGRPIQNTTIRLLDAHNLPVPLGAPGELHINGIGLAEGYWNRPDLTNFTEFGYRTGDRARFLPDGNLQFLGRSDAQVKVRGYRIEPGEITGAMECHPNVSEAALRVWSNQLVAYVSAASDLKTVEITNFLRDRLPRYMVPAQVIFMDGLPRTRHGKVDYDALPDPHRESSVAAPANEPETILAKIWSEVLGVENVGRNENFFELGGDSILSIRIVSRARREGLSLRPSDLFDHQTIEELARASAPTSTTTETDVPLTGQLPAAPIHQWFFSQAFQHPEVFHHELTLTLRASLEIAGIEERLASLLHRHDALRMAFPNGCPEIQSSCPPIALQVFDRLEQARSELRRGFDLNRAPLIRVGFIHPDKLIFVAHHLIADGVSWMTILEDLDQTGRPSAPEGIGFGRWMTLVDKKAKEGAYRDESAYWRAQQALEVPWLPIDFPGTASAENRESTRQVVSVRLSESETSALQQQGSRWGLLDVLLGSIVAAIGEWAQAKSVRIDVEGHGRENQLLDRDVTRTVGWFTSLFPVNFQVDWRRSIYDQAALVSKRLRSLPRSGAAYGSLVYQDPHTDLSAANSEILFNYLGQTDPPLEKDSLFTQVGAFDLIRHPSNQRSHLLEIDASVRAGSLGIRWHFSNRFHREETIREVAGRSLNFLRELSSQPVSPSGEGSASQIDEKTMIKVEQLLSQVDGHS